MTSMAAPNRGVESTRIRRDYTGGNRLVVKGYLAAFAALLAFTAAPAAGQDGTGAYLSSGGATAIRERGTFMTFTDQGTHQSRVYALVVSAGFRPTSRFGFEGEVQLQTGQSFPWKYTYLFAQNSGQSTTDRDIPVVGYARVFAYRGRRFAIEPLIGAGFSWHRAVSVVTSDCGPGQLPKPCEPLVPPRPGESFGTFEWLYAAGVDVPIRVSPHLAIAVTARAHHITRRQYLTGHGHRGPQVGSGNVPSFGVSMRWSSFAWGDH
jgi:hypothetical protein